jgi:hypothetical protein
MRVLPMGAVPIFLNPGVDTTLPQVSNFSAETTQTILNAVAEEEDDL